MTASASQPEDGRAGMKPSTMAPSWRGVRTAATLAALAMVVMSSCGCSMSYQLGSMFGKSDEKTATADTDRALVLVVGKEMVGLVLAPGPLYQELRQQLGV